MQEIIFYPELARQRRAFSEDLDQVLRRIWNRFGSKLFAAVAALTITFTEIGTVVLYPPVPDNVETSAASTSPHVPQFYPRAGLA